MACCKCKDFELCQCENERKVPVQQQQFLMDQRRQRKMRNKSIIFTSVLAKKSKAPTTDESLTEPNDESMEAELSQALMDAEPNDVSMDAAAAPN